MNTTSQTKTLDTKETAAAMRARLKQEFPGVKFSVRMSNGTGYGWLSVSWEDGPLDRTVKAITDTFESSRFDGMTDTYQQVQQGGSVRYSCCGVHTNRRMGAQGAADVAATINAAGGRVAVNESGWVKGEDVPADAAAQLDVKNYFESAEPVPVSLDLAVNQVFQRTAYTPSA